MKERASFKFIAIVAAVLAVAITAFLPQPEGLSFEGKMMIGVLAAAIIMWLTEALPIVVTTWVAAAMVPLLGILSPVDTWLQGVSPAMVLFLSCFAFAVFFMKSSLATRITGLIFNWSKQNSSKALFGIMVATALISTIVDNLPVTLVMLALAYKILDANGTPWGNKSALAKALALGIPFAAYIGGWATPVGCIMNVMCIGMSEASVGIGVSFINWMIVGIVLVVITLPLTWLALVKILKPEPVSQEAIERIEKEVSDLGAFTKGEIAGLIIIGLSLVFWVMGSWIPIFDTQVVGLLALGLMFLPGLKVITFEDYLSESPWQVIFLVWASGCLASGLTVTGAMDWIINGIFDPLSILPITVILILLALFACILHNLLPAGAAIAALLTVPMVTLVSGLGGNVTTAIFLCAVFSSAAFVLPLDAVVFIPYSNERKYFAIGDMAKVGWVPSIAVILAIAVIVPIICNLFGMA